MFILLPLLLSPEPAHLPLAKSLAQWDFQA